VVLTVLDGSVRPVAAVVVAALRALDVDTAASASPPPDDSAG
jgi:hypothetical protein